MKQVNDFTEVGLRGCSVFVRTSFNTTEDERKALKVAGFKWQMVEWSKDVKDGNEAKQLIARLAAILPHAAFIVDTPDKVQRLKAMNWTAKFAKFVGSPLNSHVYEIYDNGELN